MCIPSIVFVAAEENAFLKARALSLSISLEQLTVFTMTQKKGKSSTGLRLSCRTQRSSCFEVTVEKLRAKVSKKRTETERMKKMLNEMKAKLEEMESEHSRMLVENKMAIEENVHIQLYVDYILLAFLSGGNGGA